MSKLERFAIVAICGLTIGAVVFAAKSLYRMVRVFFPKSLAD